MKKNKIFKLETKGWYIERIVYLLAGVFILIGVVLTLIVNQAFIYFILLVGSMLAFFALTGYCPMSIVLKKVGFKRGCKIKR